MRGSRVALVLALLVLVAVYAGERSIVYPEGRPLRPVEIVRDSLGVPHVFAETREDLFFGQGYAAAADRIFQMDWNRRRLLGRQAEVLGKSRVVDDFRMRALTLEEVARDLYRRLDPEERAALDAYSAGINEWLRTHDLPVEFRRLGYRPDPWRAVDALVTWRGMALTLTDLTDDFDDTAEVRKDALLPSGDHPDPGSHREDRLGSNAWAVSGARSTTGHPLLAGDPHLGYSMPGALMRMALADADAAVTGFALPGVPGIAIGRTRHVAFTPTAFQGDAADVFRFPLADGRTDRYETADGTGAVSFPRPLVWLRLNRWISIPVFWQSLEMTPFGPVVKRDGGSLFVLRWAGREAIPDEGLITTRIIGARSLADIENVLGRLGLPDLNVVVADDAGGVAHYVAGRLPRRPPHRGPRDGTNPSLAWNGFWAHDAMPRRVNPPEQVVISANGHPPADHRPGPVPPEVAEAAWLGHDWPVARQARLEVLLGERSLHDVSNFTDIQRDHFVPGGLDALRELRASLAPQTLSTSAVRALAILDRWNGNADSDSIAPAVFRAWQASGPGNRGLEEAVMALERNWGPDMSGWTWGRLHQAVLRHPLGTIDSTWTTGPFARPGDRGTVDVAGYSRFEIGSRPAALSLHGPAMRMICDLSPGGATRAVLLAGQSGDPESPHYRDQLELWRSGNTVVLTAPGARPGRPESTVVLRP